MSYYVYVYLDPWVSGKFEISGKIFDNQPLYVGKGKGNRMYEHLKKTSNRIFQNKIKNWSRNEIEPMIEVLSDNLSEQEAWDLEKDLIQYIGRYDLGKGPLLNLTDGSEGPANMTPWNKGLTGQTQSEETKRRRSEALAGRKMSDEHKENIANALRGKKKSEEHKRKVSEGMKGNIPWNKGKKGVQKQSEETKRKRSEAMKKYWAEKKCGA